MRTVVIGQRLVTNPKTDIYQEAHSVMCQQRMIIPKKIPMIPKKIPMIPRTKTIKNNYCCFMLTYK